MPAPQDDSDCDSVKLLESRPATQSTAHQTQAAESSAGTLNFHPSQAREDSVEASESQAAEDPKS
jgi:hypothetical protein